MAEAKIEEKRQVPEPEKEATPDGNLPRAGATPADLKNKNAAERDQVIINQGGKVYQIDVSDEYKKVYANTINTPKEFYENMKEKLDGNDIEKTANLIQRNITQENFLEKHQEGFNKAVDWVKSDLESYFNQLRTNEDPLGGLMSRIKALIGKEQEAVLGQGIQDEMLQDPEKLKLYLGQVEKVVEKLSDDKLKEEFQLFKETIEKVMELSIDKEITEIKGVLDKPDIVSGFQEVKSSFESIGKKFKMLGDIVKLYDKEE